MDRATVSHKGGQCGFEPCCEGGKPNDALALGEKVLSSEDSAYRAAMWTAGMKMGGLPLETGHWLRVSKPPRPARGLARTRTGLGLSLLMMASQVRV